MVRLKKLTLYLYRHSFIRYLFIGASTFLIDFGILFLLHGALLLNLAASASVAYWISISYNFFLNRYWTFSSREKEDLKRHMTTYFGLLVFNYLFTVVFVSIVGEYMNYILAKILAVAIQMIWTFYVYKRYIFVSQRPRTEKS